MDRIMDRIAIDSSVITALTYDELAETLRVEFRSGRIYLYSAVPLTAYQSLINAPSVGAHFNRKVRDRYRYREIR